MHQPDDLNPDDGEKGCPLPNKPALHLDNNSGRHYIQTQHRALATYRQYGPQE